METLNGAIKFLSIDNMAGINLSTDAFQSAFRRELNGFNVAIQLICYLGLRRGEVVALPWDDYNEKEQSLKQITHVITKT